LKYLEQIGGTKNAPLNQCQLISDINWLGQMCLNNAL